MSAQEDFDPRIFSPDGQLIGHVVIAEDGSGAVAVDLDGNIAHAVDENMQPVDPAEFEYQPDTGEFDDPRLAELQQRQAELQERIENPPPTPVEQYLRGPDPGEVWGSVVGRELENLERDLGRQLTQAEAHRILSDHKADFDAGVEPSIWKSAVNANLADGSTHEGRVQRAMELMADAERSEDEVYDPTPKPSREVYDTSKYEDRVAYMSDQLAGADVTGLKLSDQPEGDME